MDVDIFIMIISFRKLRTKNPHYMEAKPRKETKSVTFF